MSSPAEIDPAVLKEVVFTYLADSNGIEEVRLKDVKRVVEKTLKLPANSFKGDGGAVISDLIVQYFSTRKTAKPDDSIYKSGKFSLAETEMVVNAIQTYMSENSLTVSDIVPVMRETAGKETRVHRSLWRNLYQLLPHRRPKAIYQHAMRSMIRPNYNGTFTAKDKEALADLIKVHGRNFTEIARIMDKPPDDCKQHALMLHERKKKGRYSEEEDRRIADAVRALTGSAETEIHKLPATDIPWAALAKMMNDERYAVDYLRRWPRAQYNSLHRAVAADHNSKVTKRISREENQEKKGDLVKYLLAKSFIDDSEVNWANVDKELSWPPRAAYIRWRSLLKECPKDMEDSYQQRLEFLGNAYSRLGSDDAIHPIGVAVLAANAASDSDSDMDEDVVGKIIQKHKINDLKKAAAAIRTDTTSYMSDDALSGNKRDRPQTKLGRKRAKVAEANAALAAPKGSSAAAASVLPVSDSDSEVEEVVPLKKRPAVILSSASSSNAAAPVAAAPVAAPATAAPVVSAPAADADAGDDADKDGKKAKKSKKDKDKKEKGKEDKPKDKGDKEKGDKDKKKDKKAKKGGKE